MQVKNQNCIRRLSWNTMRASRMRNLIAILAIGLTAVLFTALFTIALSINHSIQEANFRQVGGYSHGGFKYLTQEQFDQLKEDALIKEYGLRRFVGMPNEVPFNKSHVEVGYSDAKQAQWMYCVPTEGRLPQEGTNEAATDTRVLELLGVEPALGASFTMTFDVDGQPTTQTFTLCGWWEYDEAIVANHVLIPQSRAEAIFEQLNTQGNDGMTGTWNMDVMLDSTMRIEQDINTILANYGYQSEDYSKENYINTGVNWGYTGAQLADSMDPIAMAAIVVLLLLIIFTGYLIIYNVFQISVSNDIRFYGLLKTIGTTGRQIKRIVRQQALLLSLVGIPLGLLLGYGLGVQLTPIILSRFNGVVVDAISASPVIFIGSALFALFTVLLSCRKPSRMAAKVSPVEAMRYTEGGNGNGQQRKGQKGLSLRRMAWANLGRNRTKTIVTIISLSLAVVLLNLTVTFTNGFDMDKYISRSMVSDFVVSDAKYFQTGNIFSADMAVSEDMIGLLQNQGGIENGGRIYGNTSIVREFVTEEHYRRMHGRWNDEETLDRMVSQETRDAAGKLMDGAQIYGMERYALEKLTLLDGDISKLFEPNSRYIAAVYHYDDYGNPELDSHWAKVGDTITLRYVDEWTYVENESGEVMMQPVSWRDAEYQVAALVGVPNAMSYRYFGTDAFILNDQTFIQDTGTNYIMQYSFDTTAEGTAAMEAFLADLTETKMPQMDYESRLTYAEEFQSLQSMFLLLGGTLSFIIGAVGVLNFFNAILTGILVRRREFAVLQSIGMTGAQLKQMLVWEGLYYAMLATLLSLVLSVAAGPLVAVVLSKMFWFFTYHFTILPVLCLVPVFAALGAGLPLMMYHYVSKHSIVERLRLWML